jgi:hypothetical protein
MIWLLFSLSVPQRAGHGTASAAVGDVHQRRPAVDDGPAHEVASMASDLQREAVIPEALGPR